MSILFCLEEANIMGVSSTGNRTVTVQFLAAIYKRKLARRGHDGHALLREEEGEQVGSSPVSRRCYCPLCHRRGFFGA